MSKEETLLIKKCRTLPIKVLSSCLAGRTVADIEAYLDDLEEGKVNGVQKVIILSEDELAMSKMPPMAVDMGRRINEYRHDSILSGSLGAKHVCRPNSFKEVASWAGCSGSVIQIATTNTALPCGLYTCLVGSATETDQSRLRTPGAPDPYNRPGELVTMQMDPAKLQCKVLNGHWLDHPDGRQMRSTVTCVVYSDNNSAYFSGGYDGNVSVWSDDRLALLTRFGGHKSVINCIAADSKTYGLMYGTSNGEIFWCADPLASEDGTPPTPKTVCQARVVEGQGLPFADSVDVLQLTTNGSSNGRAFAAYGHLTTAKSGVVQVYDLGTLENADCIKLEYQKSLTDFALHPTDQTMAIGTGILFDNKALSGDGNIRLYDLRTYSQSMPSILTKQTDIHRLAFSPSGNLIYSNDASSGMMLVHDLRNTCRPLWSHSHSQSQTQLGTDDHFMGFSWMADDRLVTGGNDSILKIWDMNCAEPLIESHDVKQPINNIALSADGTQMWVGTEVGSLHWFSRSTSLTASFSDNMTITYDS